MTTQPLEPALNSSPGRYRGRIALSALAVLVVAPVAGCSSQGSSHQSSSHGPGPSSSSEPPLGFRGQPSFLPTSSESVDAVVTASPGQPQLAVQGVGVQVEVPAGRVLATITGPHVPPFVAPPPPSVTATFDVSLAAATGQIPIRLSDFTITDQLGRSFHPTLVAREADPPKTAPAGRTTTFSLTAVMPTGEGRIYWSPAGASPIVGWDFIVEND